MDDFKFRSNSIDYKSTIDDDGVKRYFVKGHIDSGDIDLVNDIVTKSCMVDIENQIKQKSLKLDLDHETLRNTDNRTEDKLYNITRIPLGKSVTSGIDNKGNYVEFELNPNWKKFDAKGNVVMTFDEVWASIKSGFYDAFSIAYVPIRTENRLIGDIKARMLDKVNIINVALTGNPINPYATMTEIFAKSRDFMVEKEDLKRDIDELKSVVDSIVFETEFKHKYRSRKKVGGKWVYDYGDDKKPTDKKQTDIFNKLTKVPKEELDGVAMATAQDLLKNQLDEIKDDKTKRKYLNMAQDILMAYGQGKIKKERAQDMIIDTRIEAYEAGLSDNQTDYSNILDNKTKKIISDSVSAAIYEGNDGVNIDTDKILSLYTEKLSTEENKKFDWDKAEDYILDYSNNLFAERNKKEEKSMEENQDKIEDVNKTEIKSDYVEVKSFIEMKSKVELLEKSIKDLTDVLDGFKIQGKGAEPKQTEEPEIKSRGVLDLI